MLVLGNVVLPLALVLWPWTIGHSIKEAPSYLLNDNPHTAQGCLPSTAPLLLRLDGVGKQCEIEITSADLEWKTFAGVGPGLRSSHNIQENAVEAEQPILQIGHDTKFWW